MQLKCKNIFSSKIWHRISHIPYITVVLQNLWRLTPPDRCTARRNYNLEIIWLKIVEFWSKISINLSEIYQFPPTFNNVSQTLRNVLFSYQTFLLGHNWIAFAPKRSFCLQYAENGTRRRMRSNRPHGAPHFVEQWPTVHPATTYKLISRT